MKINYFDTTNLDDTPIFSNKIHIKKRNKSKYFYLDGFITYKGERKRIHRVTNKEINKPNRIWLERNLHQTLWELSDFYKEIQQQIFDEMSDTTPTVEDFGWKSLNMHKFNRKITTQKKIENIFKNHILPNYGNRKLNSFKSSELTEFQNSLSEKNLSSKTIKNIRSVLNTIFEDSIRDKFIEMNPFSNVSSPKKTKRYDVDPFTIDEVTEILQNLNERHKPMFVLAFFSGMRWGEIIGLQWKDIDFTKNQISIKQTVVMGYILDPKTEESERDIDMLPIVKKYLEIQKEKKLDDKWVFVNQYGDFYRNTNNINSKIFKPLLDKLGLKSRPIKQSRQTFASMMLSKNEDILWVSKTMGHTDKTITLNTYSKYVRQPKIKRGIFSDTLPI